MYARSLGLDPDELGSPARAALTSLFTFAVGAAIPLIPWFFWSGGKASLSSIALGAAAATALGSLLGYLGGRNILWSATGQVFVLIIAATATWGAGKLFNVTVR